MTWTLIIFAYVSFGDKESNAIAVVNGFTSEESCRAAARQASGELDPTGQPDFRFSCLRVNTK